MLPLLKVEFVNEVNPGDGGEVFNFVFLMKGSKDGYHHPRSNLPS
jgi:hypothetical protein